MNKNLINKLTSDLEKYSAKLFSKPIEDIIGYRDKLPIVLFTVEEQEKFKSNCEYLLKHLKTLQNKFNGN
jgi:hypothetical protein